MSAIEASRAGIEAQLRGRARWGAGEIAFWIAVPMAIFAFPSRAALANEILIAGLFALSLDLILGLAGIVSLGHAAFFGLGAYAAAILSNAGFGDPILGLVTASAIAAALGLATRNAWLTGGADGLNIAMSPVLGLFPIGFTGQRNAALYSLAVLFALFVLARRISRSPFGLGLAAIRENRLRAGALGISTSRRIVLIYALSAAYAGAAGALLAQTTQIVSLDLFDFHRSADVMLMLIIGGAGYLYGGPIGAAVFIVVKDVISAATPEYWEFWIGALLVTLVLSGRERVGKHLLRTLGRLAPGMTK